MFMAIFCQVVINMYSNFEASFNPRLIQMKDYDNPITVLENDKNFGELTNAFANLKENSQLIELNDTEIPEWLLNELNGGKIDLGSYRRDYVVGGNFAKMDTSALRPALTFLSGALGLPSIPDLPNVTILNGLYNSVPKHAKPLAVNFMSNTLLEYLDSSDVSRRITVTNHPLPFSFTVSIEYVVE